MTLRLWGATCEMPSTQTIDAGDLLACCWLVQRCFRRTNICTTKLQSQLASCVWSRWLSSPTANLCVVRSTDQKVGRSRIVFSFYCFIILCFFRFACISVRFAIINDSGQLYRFRANTEKNIYMSCGDVTELSKKPRRHVGRTGPTYLEQKASQNAKC